MSEHWAHHPPCPQGGFVEVAASVAVASAERCPFCRSVLVPPEEVRRVRETDERLAAKWCPRTPREILAMAQENRP